MEGSFKRVLGRMVGVHQHCITLFTLEGINGDGGIGDMIDDALQNISKILTLVSIILY